MAKPGDRVIVEGSKVGGGRREGELLATVGRMLRVRWPDGTESMLTPGPGTVKFEAGSSRPRAGSGVAASRKAAPKGKAAARKPARKPAAKKKR